MSPKLKAPNNILLTSFTTAEVLVYIWNWNKLIFLSVLWFSGWCLQCFNGTLWNSLDSCRSKVQTIVYRCFLLNLGIHWLWLELRTHLCSHISLLSVRQQWFILVWIILCLHGRDLVTHMWFLHSGVSKWIVGWQTQQPAAVVQCDRFFFSLVAKVRCKGVGIWNAYFFVLSDSPPSTSLQSCHTCVINICIFINQKHNISLFLT